MNEFKDVYREHTEIQNNPNYNPDEYPRAFENALEMVAKKNGLYMKRTNRIDKYRFDAGIFDSKTNKLVLRCEAEYDASGKCFDPNNKYLWVYYEMNMPLEKYNKYILMTDVPVVYIKGSKDLKFVCLAKFKNFTDGYNKLNEPSNHQGIIENRDFRTFRTSYKFKKGLMKKGLLQDWFILVKQLYNIHNYV